MRGLYVQRLTRCAHVKVIASEAEMNIRFARTSSRLVLIIKSCEKECRGRRGAEERESVKRERGKKRAHTSEAATSRCRGAGGGGEGRPRG